ncbi:hypothetical protein GY45DRAFT_502013 [Cubamyces sp. BRFM 1775]|nr:hypothetical protein GY45DRAFT_502013 [Cubamyces sp. BRFM 1775]
MSVTGEATGGEGGGGRGRPSLYTTHRQSHIPHPIALRRPLQPHPPPGAILISDLISIILFALRLFPPPFPLGLHLLHTFLLWSALHPRPVRVASPDATRQQPLLFLCPLLLLPLRCFLPPFTFTRPTPLVTILLRPLFPSHGDDESFRNSDPIGQPVPRVRPP